MEQIPSIQYLEDKGIGYKIKTFPEDTDKGTGPIAKVLGVEPDVVIKTLIMKGTSGKIYVCLIGGEAKLRVKKLKKITQEKDIQMAPSSDILEATGYAIGAIPPFALKNKLDVFMDESLKKHQELYVGAGKFGYEIIMTPENLQKATDGNFVNIIK